ncbi:TPA: hypothetical protein RRX84_005673, partial [Klebsiella pneumoniae]|nr:hypothetical protein [Klebsiella pneumoniae]
YFREVPQTADSFQIIYRERGIAALSSSPYNSALLGRVIRRCFTLNTGHELDSELAQRIPGIISGGNALVPDIGSQRNLPNAMLISDNKATGSLNANIRNNIQLGQVLQV